MAKRADYQHDANPSIVDVVAQNFTHFVHIDILVEPIEEANADGNRHADFDGVAQYLSKSLLHNKS